MIRAALTRVPFPLGISAVLPMVVGFAWLLSMAGLADAVEFTKIVDALTPIPGQSGSNFLVFPTPPAYDGSKVVFAAQPGTRQLWTANPDGGGFTKLADSNTPIPGGTGHFGDVCPYRVSNGTVVFRGNDDNQQAGYYAVPAIGSAIIMLVNQSTIVPNIGGPFGAVGLTTSFGLSGSTFVFARNTGGVYGVSTGGGVVSAVADPNIFVCEPKSPFGGFGNRSILTCRTDSQTGACTSQMLPVVTTQINAGETPTFAILIFGNGGVPFNPATNRILMRFKDAGNVTRGSTSVAVLTQ